MKRLLTRLTALAVGNWLRVGLLCGAVVLLSQKEVNFSIRLGAAEGQTEVQDRDRTVMLSALEGLGGYLGIGTTERTTVLEATELDPVAVARFVERFGHVAVAEREKFDIPASLILAHGLLASKAGTSAAALERNAYFDPTGPGHETAWASFRAFSLRMKGSGWEDASAAVRAIADRYELGRFD